MQITNIKTIIIIFFLQIKFFRYNIHVVRVSDTEQQVY